MVLVGILYKIGMYTPLVSYKMKKNGLLMACNVFEKPQQNNLKNIPIFHQ